MINLARSLATVGLCFCSCTNKQGLGHLVSPNVMYRLFLARFSCHGYSNRGLLVDDLCVKSVEFYCTRRHVNLSDFCLVFDLNV